MSAVELKVDLSRIKQAIQSGLPYTITTYALPHEMEVYMSEVLTAFLKLSDKGDFKDYLTYCVQELVVNAKKANTKRVYFLEKGLKIDMIDDYKLGMQTFKKDTMENIGHYLALQKEQGLYVKLLLALKNDSIQIEVRNNSVIARAELIRIYDRLARSQQFNSIEEAFDHVIDDSEGAGLGIVVMVLMLKKMGLGKNAFNISCNEIETIAKIVVPLDRARLDTLSVLTRTIVDSVNSLPRFPENILKVQNLLNDPKSEMSEIATVISRDPAMTADLIKIVNSAVYMRVKRVDSIGEAVKFLGIKGIKNLLYSYGTQKVLGDDTSEKKKLWDHAYRTAFYAYNLVQNFRRDRDILDDVYVAGILHDMGKIIFSQFHPDLFNKIQSFCSGKAIPTTFFENVAGGMNHAEIGALIAEKWNFPENLVMAIRFHHTPSEAPSAHRLVEAVYLANIFVHIENGDATFEQIDTAVLKNYGIASKKQVQNLITKFSEGFRAERQF
ncbi:MAG: HDOD domain-containing protein [Spirochaetaceae bacterium]|jgi:putative nucleotidyltransferase with HDIG domain|nr:HDOD domain-containing protein [Spirochaetaceae bacterium]